LGKKEKKRKEKKKKEKEREGWVTWGLGAERKIEPPLQLKGHSATSTDQKTKRTTLSALKEVV
jgi:hypothetical protein